MLDPLRDLVKEAMLRGDSSINVDPPTRPLTQIILGPPLRDYFIKRVKEPFLKAVIFFSKKYPEPSKANCTGHWTAPFMEALDKLVNYVQYRKNFFVAVRRIVIGEIEHDSMYRDPIIAILEWLIEDILDGKIPPREEGRPGRQYWLEPPPYGGKYSIIYKIRVHRKEINDLLGRKNE